MSELTKPTIGPTHRWSYSSYKQRTKNNKHKCLLQTEQLKYWKALPWINGEKPADIGLRGMSIESLLESGWLNGSALLQTDEEIWPQPFCQLNEVEAEPAASTVHTETKLDQFFDWRQYTSFNRIKNFLAYRKRFKTKQKGSLKADEIYQAVHFF